MSMFNGMPEKVNIKEEAGVQSHISHTEFPLEVQTADGGPLYFAFVDENQPNANQGQITDAKNRFELVYSEFPDEVMAVKGMPMKEARAKLLEIEEKVFAKANEKVAA